MRRTWSTWVALCLFAGGCTPLDLTVLSPGQLARSRILPEPPGAACPYGGQALQTGLDLNEDGELGADEVTLTQYACAKAPTSEPTPAQVVVRTLKLDPGTPCPDGGQVTQAGLDTNGNGTLDDEEVTREVHTCQGAVPVRARVRPVATHVLCPSIATVLEAGEDADGNGVLDPSEVQASHPFCEVDTPRLQFQLQPEPAGGRCGRPGTRVDAYGDLNGNGQRDADTEPAVILTVCQSTRVYEGTYVVADAADLAVLQGVTRVTGDLRVTSETLTGLTLPELSVVQGSLGIESNALLSHVALPGLRFARDVALNDNAVLATAALGDAAGSQVHVDRNLSVRGNPQLASLDGLRALTPRNELGVSENALLETFTFPYVTSLPGGLAVQRNPKLRTFSLPALASAEGLSLSQNAALESLAGLPGLRTVEHLDIFSNGALTSLSGFDTLISANSITVARNAKLQTMTGFLPNLIRAGSVLIGDNAALESAGGMSSLRTVSESFTLRNNARLQRVTDLESLEAIFSLTVELNPMLTDLGGFGPLLRMERLSVRYNRDLQELSRLNELRYLQFLKLTDNPSLTGLGLESLLAVEQGFSVENNPLLPTCRVQQLADRAYSGSPFELSILGNDNQTPCQP
ncbi:hypothetical protein D7Y13_30915 [Corallococcus praedator]|uniref:DUF7151 domain-containing protein n=1 Tax=Corallococcus praedator TaxID=2316724 RepID=A0ABX9QAC3_9BACT|nr:MULTISPECIES: hypothetical protein [Corallococcus]RKH22661.1 hypothetical protein D7X75_35105 [Corallococcus sp. CA031C]RKH96409.1 hypothetical protein D7Y13_30915 [Corallococcus praedator]